MGNNLAKIRGKHQMTQKELAEKMGITKQGLSLNEQDKLSLKMATKAAEILDENLFEILGSDVLVAIPKTEQDKKIVIDMIKEL